MVSVPSVLAAAKMLDGGSGTPAAGELPVDTAALELEAAGAFDVGVVVLAATSVGALSRTSVELAAMLGAVELTAVGGAPLAACAPSMAAPMNAIIAKAALSF